LNVSYDLHTLYIDTLFLGIYLKLGKNCYRVHICECTKKQKTAETTICHVQQKLNTMRRIRTKIPGNFGPSRPKNFGNLFCFRSMRVSPENALNSTVLTSNTQTVYAKHKLCSKRVCFLRALLEHFQARTGLASYRV